MTKTHSFQMSAKHKPASYSPPPCLVLELEVQIGPDAVQSRDRSYLHRHFKNYAELGALLCRFEILRHLGWMSFCPFQYDKVIFRSLQWKIYQGYNVTFKIRSSESVNLKKKRSTSILTLQLIVFSNVGPLCHLLNYWIRPFHLIGFFFYWRDWFWLWTR